MFRSFIQKLYDYISRTASGFTRPISEGERSKGREESISTTERAEGEDGEAEESTRTIVITIVTPSNSTVTTSTGSGECECIYNRETDCVAPIYAITPHSNSAFQIPQRKTSRRRRGK
jgi:hypothetical protein